MADAKISDLPVLSPSEVLQEDLLAVVDVSANTTKKVTKNAFLWKPAPPTPTSPGQAGDMAFNATHVFICVATNTWRRIDTHTGW